MLLTYSQEDVVEEEEEAPVQNVSPKTSVKSFPAIDVLSIYKRNRESRIGKELLDQRRSLPVFQFKSKFLELFRSRNLIIVAGETGSGKSTQIPQFVLEASCDFLVVPKAIQNCVETDICSNNYRTRCHNNLITWEFESVNGNRIYKLFMQESINNAWGITPNNNIINKWIYQGILGSLNDSHRHQRETPF